PVSPHRRPHITQADTKPRPGCGNPRHRASNATRYINTQRTILVRDTARSKINSSVSRIATTAVSQPEGGRRDIQVIDPSDSIASITHICNDQRIAAKKVANTVMEYPARPCLNTSRPPETAVTPAC